MLKRFLENAAVVHASPRGMLGLDATATPEQIRKAYEVRLDAFRPDRFLRKIQEAYREELVVFRGDTERARGLLAVGESSVDESGRQPGSPSGLQSGLPTGLPELDPAEHAAMTIVASMIHIVTALEMPHPTAPRAGKPNLPYISTQLRPILATSARPAT